MSYILKFVCFLVGHKDEVFVRSLDFDDGDRLHVCQRCGRRDLFIRFL